jgi:hypothetical protein
MPGAFILDAAGTYVSEAAHRLVIGNRPGLLHYSIALAVPAFCLILLWFFRDDAWWLGTGALVLFGLPAVLLVFNSQRCEVTPGHVAMRGRAAGFRVTRDWPLPADSAVRIDTRIERKQETPDLWTSYQAQILTSQGWIPIAESMQRARALEFAERLAHVAGVRILNSSTRGER